MKVGFSFSPGGLLLPYHLGVLDCLQANHYLLADTPIAGASAGAIAVATHACAIDSKLILDDSIKISQTCQEMGRARGNLLPLLRRQLEHRVDADRFQAVLDRPGETVISYYELFPSFRPIHQVDFNHKEEFIDSVCHSSTFPFFSSNWPVALDHAGGSTKSMRLFGQTKSLIIPRLVVDGYFAAPRDRFGCPDFEEAGVAVNRTVVVSVFPKEVVGLNKGLKNDGIICPDLIDDGIGQSSDLLRLATQPSEPEELMAVYDSGYQDAENWCQKESKLQHDLDMALKENARKLL